MGCSGVCRSAVTASSLAAAAASVMSLVRVVIADCIAVRILAMLIVGKQEIV